LLRIPGFLKNAASPPFRQVFYTIGLGVLYGSGIEYCYFTILLHGPITIGVGGAGRQGQERSGVCGEVKK
jgi:hypothetical protein